MLGLLQMLFDCLKQPIAVDLSVSAEVYMALRQEAISVHGQEHGQHG